MEESMAETSVAEMSEEIIYTSLRFSPASPACAKDVLRNRAPQRWSSVLCNMAVCLGLLTAFLLMATVIWVIWRTDSSCPGCPDQWVGYGNSCYYFAKEKKDWNSSQASCSAEGSHLVVMSDTKKMDLFSLMNAASHWIGLRQSNGTDWVWEDGSKLNHTNIISNSPVQRCAVLLNGALQASSCEVPFPWICEKSLK